MRIFTQQMRVFQTIVSLCLAALVLVSSTTFSVGLHVCRGHVSHIAVMQKAQPCAMERLAAELGFSDEDCGMSNKMKCCEDRTLSFEGTDYQYKTSKSLTVQEIVPVQAMLPVLLSSVLPPQSQAYTSFRPYKPPLIHRDVIVLVQRFLI